MELSIEQKYALELFKKGENIYQNSLITLLLIVF